MVLYRVLFHSPHQNTVIPTPFAKDLPFFIRFHSFFIIFIRQFFKKYQLPQKGSSVSGFSILFVRAVQCMPEPHCLNYCSFIVSLEVGQYQASNFVLLPQYGDDLQSHLTNFRISLLIYIKYLARILTGTALNQQLKLRSDISTLLSLPVPDTLNQMKNSVGTVSTPLLHVSAQASRPSLTLSASSLLTSSSCHAPLTQCSLSITDNNREAKGLFIDSVL